MKAYLSEEEWYPVLTVREVREGIVGVEVPQELIDNWEAAAAALGEASAALRPYYLGQRAEEVYQNSQPTDVVGWCGLFKGELPQSPKSLGLGAWVIVSPERSYRSATLEVVFRGKSRMKKFCKLMESFDFWSSFNFSLEKGLDCEDGLYSVETEHKLTETLIKALFLKVSSISQ